MSLARLASAVQQTVLSSMRIAPGAQSLHFTRCFAGAAGAYMDKNAVTDRVLSAVKNFEKVKNESVSPTSSFKELGLDSLDTVEVVMAMEEEFGVEIPDSEADKILSVNEAIDYFAAHPHAK